jgi:hypothetical protein
MNPTDLENMLNQLEKKYLRKKRKQELRDKNRMETIKFYGENKEYLLRLGIAISTISSAVTMLTLGGILAFNNLASREAYVPTPTNTQPFQAPASPTSNPFQPTQASVLPAHSCTELANLFGKSTWETCWEYTDASGSKSDIDNASAIKWIGPTDLSETTIGQYNQTFISEWYDWARQGKPVEFCIDLPSMAEVQGSVEPIDKGCYEWERGPFMIRIAETFNEGYAIVSIREHSDFTDFETNLGMEPGFHIFHGVPFITGRKVTTQCGMNSSAPTSVPFNVNINNPESVNVLIQAGWGLREYSLKQIGDITLEFSDGSSYEKPLILGMNIRDWARTNPAAVSVAPEVLEAWSGEAYGQTGGVDLLKIPIPEEYRALTLTRITLNDTSERNGSLDPCFHLIGVSVKYNYQAIDRETISRGIVNELSYGLSGVETVRECVDRAHEGRSFESIKPGDLIPAGSLIATNYGVMPMYSWRDFPVTPVCYSGSYGLFESIDSYVSVHEGAYWIIK